MLNFDTFSKHEGIELINTLKNQIRNLQNQKFDMTSIESEQNADLDALITKYDNYCERTLNGEFCLTPKY